MRDIKYNATVESIREVRPWLRIFASVPTSADSALFRANTRCWGWATGNRAWPEQVHLPLARTERLVQRAYSFSCCMLDADGELVAAGEEELVEFYIVLASGTAEHPAGLTPRLFHLRAGDRLFVGPRAKGTYTLSPVAPRR